MELGGNKRWAILKLIVFMGFLTFCKTQAQEYTSYFRKKYTRQDSLRGALSPERLCFDVYYYDLQVKIPPKKGKIVGSNRIYFQAKKPSRVIQLDLYLNMAIKSVYLRSPAFPESDSLKTLSYWREHNTFWVAFEEELQTGSVYCVEVVYEGTPKTDFPDTRKGFHWTKDRKRRPWVGVSCEYEGASVWWPNKDHLSDEPDSMRIHIEAPAELQCISNGRLEGIDSLGTEKLYHWFVSYPIDNYNVSFYIGHYVRDTLEYTGPGGKHTLELYTKDYHKRYVDNYFKVLKPALKYFEILFGKFPFWRDKLAVVESMYPGMEHQSCFAVGGIQEIGDRAFGFQLPYPGVLVHELAHEWWGNSVSVKDMADAWIQEGFATYAELLLIERLYGYKKYKEGVKYMEQFIHYTFPLVGNPEVNDLSFINNDIYYRGALLLHEIREEIDDTKVFFNILHGFYQRFQYQTVTSQDFIDIVNEFAPKDMSKFIQDRLYTQSKVE